MPYLTPDLADFENIPISRIVTVASGLFHYIYGAIDELTFAENWEPSGDASPEETANYFRQILTEVQMSVLVLGQYALVGMVAYFAGDYAPVNWLPMDGTVRTKADYPELFAIIPASWKSGTNFTLPNMAATAPIGTGTKSSRTFTLGTAIGETDHTLTVAEEPVHNHQVKASPNNADSETASGNYLATFTGLGNHYRSGTPGTLVAINNSTVGTQGGGASHENMPPSMPLTCCIYAGRS